MLRDMDASTTWPLFASFLISGEWDNRDFGVIEDRGDMNLGCGVGGMVVCVCVS